ncbi:MAG: peptidase [Rhodovulum sulfidophilum]|uniref:Peptidase n=1 Tax=Rhodovulum sulfidophilum TaxID=35806 RepID=A0A2W5NG45_RHOSU|nr:MAG: peptidase [Rhodovulum sulfidophilum]
MRVLLATLAAGALAAPAFAQDKAAVVKTYADIAEAGYSDSLTTAQRLQAAVQALVDQPSPEALAAAKQAWLQARVPYQQTEVYRFGNAIVDDWEGKVNAWPLDEGMIDYVDPGYGGATDENPFAALNVIANEKIQIGGEEIDATVITPALLEEKLQEAGAIETNVATGYHAIEFLLWGQDLNGTEPGAGARPWTDYAKGDACTNDNCDRRGAYLTAATELLVSDLDWMAKQWGADGEARKAVTGNPDTGVVAMLTGMGSLSYGEQAGERMRLGLMLNDPEEEHDCFSDNTHNSHYYDGIGIRNVYLGHYVGVDGRVIEGPSLADLTKAADPTVDADMRAALTTTIERLGELKIVAESGTAYDQMLDANNVVAGAVIQRAVDALVAQTKEIERVVAVLKLDQIAFEGSDSLDNPSAVFQ